MTARDAFAAPILLSARGALLLSACVYLLALVYLALWPSRACALLSSLDGGHTCSAPVEADHAADCALTTGTLRGVCDRFVVAHAAGWLAKGALLPRRRVLWRASVGFEAVEWLLSGALPTLRECWWDSLVLDVLVCNFIGLELGCRFAARYGGGAAAGAGGRRGARDAVLLTGLVVTDVNAFLVKHALALHSASPLNVARLVLLYLLAIPSVAHICSRSSSPSPSPAPFAHLYTTILFSEVMLALSFYLVS